jgi:hypothetical protein
MLIEGVNIAERYEQGAMDRSNKRISDSIGKRKSETFVNRHEGAKIQVRMF